MNERVTKRRHWRIGELARATGLTVRTLRHYERLGLLAPPSRTDGRQRLYDELDVRRLYRICALKDLGLPLAKIRSLLDDSRASLSEILHAHRSAVEVELERLERLRALLDHACARAERDPSADEVLATIDAMSRVSRRIDARRRNAAEPSDEESRWRELGDALRRCMDAGEAPSAPRPRELARAARARIVEFAGGDRATLEALAHLRRFAAPQDLAGWDPALMQYLDQALAWLDKMEVEHVDRADRKERRTGGARPRVRAARQPE